MKPPMPQSPEELAQWMGSAGASRQTILLGGNFSKRRMGGPVQSAQITISTAGLNRVLQYEPHDLTISVEAGMTYCQLIRMLGEHRQMIPLDPPFSATATIGGILATNGSGPRRKLYGTARDLVIGMKFATLEGKLVQSGGMVVKNVAGLDMAKLLIGSFGTLAAIAVVNFKLLPKPARERSFLLSFDALPDAIAARDAILKSPLQPEALDLLNPAAAAHLGSRAYYLAVQAGGNAAAIERYEQQLGAWGRGVALEGHEEEALWAYIREFTPVFLDAVPDGAVARVSCTLKELRRVFESTSKPVIARAGSGVFYAYFSNASEAAVWAREAADRGWKAVIEFAPDSARNSLDLWPAPGRDLELMQRIKDMFDPHHLLNRGRLYRRL